MSPSHSKLDSHLTITHLKSVDNSEYMRNGDYSPTRFGAQSDAVSVIFGTKTQSNPENTVGVMTMAGKTCVSLLALRLYPPLNPLDDAGFQT